ncbi:MAG: orotate phosphoribosyltransferase-like protein [Thermoplasmata archaeon]|nr:orotate phosphoribosyltransferase-like protein [Thermoplasmata archaeon]
MDSGIEPLVEKALALREKGLTRKEIALELHLSEETVSWLLARGIKTEKPPADIYVGWKSVGVFPTRLQHIAAIISDIIFEELEKRDEEVDTIVGIALNGIPLAVLVAQQLDVEMTIFRPTFNDSQGIVRGSFASNYATVEGKKVIVVDDVLSTGKTMSKAIESIKEHGGTPVLACVVVNKTQKNEIEGVPLRGLIRTTVV